MNEQEHTRRIAESICEKFSWNGRTFKEGEFVAILDGKIIAVSKNADEAIVAVRSVAPDPQRGMVVEVAHPVVDVIR